MLPLPQTGKDDIQIFTDWIEGSLLFTTSDHLSLTDIVDSLLEEQIYDDQDKASQWLENVWSELRRREKLLGAASPFAVEDRHVRRVSQWHGTPAYAFCLLVPLIQASPKWLRARTKSEQSRHYLRQGVLFEKISDEALQRAGWKTHRTGWSQTQAKRLESVLEGVSQHVRESIVPNWEKNVSKKKNEVGLDLIYCQPFSDQRCGFPIYLAQCASGDNWDTKLHQPNLSQWVKLIDFAAPPQKVFAIPHALSEQKHREVTNQAGGIVLDRYRLHSNWVSGDKFSAELSSELTQFLTPLVKDLPTLV